MAEISVSALETVEESKHSWKLWFSVSDFMNNSIYFNTSPWSAALSKSHSDDEYLRGQFSRNQYPRLALKEGE